MGGDIPDGQRAVLQQDAREVMLCDQSRSNRARNFSKQLEHRLRALVRSLRFSNVDSAKVIDAKTGFAIVMNGSSCRRSMGGLEAMLELSSVKDDIGVATAAVRVRDGNRVALHCDCLSSSFKDSGGELGGHDCDFEIWRSGVLTGEFLLTDLNQQPAHNTVAVRHLSVISKSENNEEYLVVK